eukprot:1955497-Rhodomonas_salina.1
MPCFDATGAKIPGAWQGNNITAATRQQWVAMQALRARVFSRFLPSLVTQARCLASEDDVSQPACLCP